ncbi:AraC family transcriptional regulator [Brucella sp. IR073]|uniref:AraC family transcriptional regulator n=1 Tax=unclassified Brucella TaxID=2632610 RepID=UPI003B9820D4
MIDQKSETRSALRPQPSPDLISELLLGMRLNGIQYRRIQMSPPFGISYGEAEGRAQFHFVARGPVIVRTAAGTVQKLDSQDAVLLPRGGRHELLSAPDLPSRDIVTYEAVPLCATVGAIKACKEETCRSTDAVIFSGCMDFDLGAMHPLVSLMPEMMHVGTLLGRQPEILPMLEAMEREARMERAGYAGILARLADVVSASIVRGWVECGCGDATGWVDALRDPKLSRVIAALHRDPGRDWTVAELAAEMGTSRSVFAERFLEVTGMTPVRYLTELRMRLAAQWIGREKLPIESVAHRLGYGSQAAFSRAFKRVVGHSPGMVRAASSRAEQHL